MVRRDRSADDLSEVVRRRLEALLAEIPPRRGVDTDEISPPSPATEPERRPVLAVPAGDNPEPDPPVAARSRAPLMAWAPRVRQFVGEHLIVVGIVVLSGVLWGGYSLMQARSVPVAAAAQPSVAISAASPTPGPTATTQLLVHVLGEVRRPGVVKLPEGARVQDALVAAGGLTRRARPGDLNLAAPVADGAQLIIGRTGSQVRGAGGGGGGGGSGGAAGAGTTGKIDLNTATAEQLDALPGVGPVTAQKILAWRAAHGRFRSPAELQEIDGIGPKSYAEIAPHVRV